MLNLVEVVLVLPVATAKVERAFSLMGRIKSDWRVNLNTETVDDLMMISLKGPPEDKFSGQAAIANWWKAGKQDRRPATKPSGTIKFVDVSTQESDDDESDSDDTMTD